MEPDELRAEIEKYPWYHTIDLGGGVTTPGMFDHRGFENKHLIPADLSGMRCLDVGTMDGFWAFTMERRGAAEVTALDIEDPSSLDWPASLRPTVVKTMDETKATRFALVQDALGSKVKRVPRSVYQLDTDLGEFDLVFCGDLLVHLKDPVTALERIHRVCRGSAIICNPVKRFVLYERRPLAEIDGIGEFQWWVTNLRGLERLVRAAGFSRVDVGRPFELPAVAGGDWKGRRGVVRGYV
ncbi:MAG TPA: class I SAM-dependent methyltransferase [Acidimicrobiales bacterium]|nr:class I SAM-dependent methyltransferase [Acidimicrobiales bacterium]